MIKKMIFNNIKNNKLMSAATVFFMTASAVLISLAVVIMLFIKLITEKKRHEISLQKALGFRSEDVTKRYFVKGIIPAAAGIFIGVLLSDILGEGLCGAALKLLGADSFSFVIDGLWTYLILPVIMLATLAASVLTSIYSIRKISAFECCYGKE